MRRVASGAGGQRPTAVLFERVDELNAQVDEIDKQMRMLVRENEELRRLTLRFRGWAR